MGMGRKARHAEGWRGAGCGSGWAAHALYHRRARNRIGHNLGAMADKLTRGQVDGLLDLGFSHQQAFDQLVLEYPDEKPGRVARLLKHRPSRAAREHYCTLHQALLGLVVSGVALHLWVAVDALTFDREHPWRFIGLVPFATLFMAYALYRWDGRHFQWVGWMNIIGAAGALRVLSKVAMQGPPSVGGAGSLVSVAIGVLALYLHRRAFPKCKGEKDPLHGGKRYVFSGEGMW